MNHARSLFVAVLTLLVAAPLGAAETRLYRHPSLEFQFRAPVGWQQQPRPGDDGTYEVADPESGVHVLLWTTSTEQDALPYLRKMASMMDLVVDAEPQPRRIDARDAWVLELSGTIVGKPIRTLLAVMQVGMSRAHPAENELYIVQVWSPADAFRRNAPLMQSVLGSVKITTDVSYRGRTYPLYPATLSDPPELPSPFTTADGEEFVVARTRDGDFALLRITVEDGAPLDYARDQWGKGLQLEVDSDDFPALARSGLHDDVELRRTRRITGRSVAAISAEARPGGASRAGFIAHDEDIISVLRGDNRIVSRLGLTHPRLARPLFNVFNVTLRATETYVRKETPWNSIDNLLWNGRRIFVDGRGGKGWQESIFADDVLGYFELRIWRQLEPAEEAYLRERYATLADEQLDDLMEMLTSIHTGEMVPFYVMRYGFYEGHTDYRADPIAIASVFGLISIPEIDAAVGGNLYEVLTRSHSGAAAG